MRSSVLASILVVASASWGCGTDISPTGPDAPTSSPTFYQDVSPILVVHCLGCHQPGGIAPFSLVTYADATAAGIPAQMQASVDGRIMPPFLADDSGGCQTYQGPGWLTDAELHTIDDWVAAGTPEGMPPDPLPAPPALPALPHVDATLAMPAPYTPDQSVTDDYRCFVIAPSPALSANEYVTGFEVVPGNPAVVHHAILFSIDTAQAESQAEALDTGGGYTCFGDSGVQGTSIVAAWAPGEGANIFPTDTGIPLTAGRKMILQVHYHVVPGAAPDQSTVHLMLAPTVAHPGAITLLSNNHLVIPPNVTNYTIPDTFQIPTTVSAVNVWGVFPHMHLTGENLKVTAHDGGGDTCMVSVPRWDFDWQRFYYYASPTTLHGGDQLELDCTYDTQDRTTTTYFGDGTEDEMCIAGFYTTE